MLQNRFSLRQFKLTKWSFFLHSITRNAPYVHPKLEVIPISCRNFQIVHVYVLNILLIRDETSIQNITGGLRRMNNVKTVQTTSNTVCEVKWVRPEFFLLVDLRDFFSDLGSGGGMKKNK